MGAEGAVKVTPKAPLHRRAREIPPKAGVSRVYDNSLSGYMNEHIFAGILTWTTRYHFQILVKMFQLTRIQMTSLNVLFYG